MPILNEFCDALKQAISNYEGEVQPVPIHRQQEIQALRTRIDQCLQEKMDSVEFREEMVEYTKIFWLDYSHSFQYLIADYANIC